MARGFVAVCLLALFCTPAAMAHRNLLQGESACPTVFEPVCGDDDMVYSNACEAEAAGVDWACVGVCVCPVPQLKVDATSTFCKTSSSAVLDLVGSGSGTAKATSFCEAEAEATSDIQELVSTYIDTVFTDPKTGCTVNTAMEVATATATAAAKVVTSVSTQVNIDGTGVACAEGFATGDAFATAIVDITVKIYLSLVEDTFGKDTFDEVSKKFSSADGNAVGRAVAAVISSAWAQATVGVCTTNGFKEGADTSLAEAVREATAFLWAEVVLTLCETIGQDTTELKEWRSELSESDSKVSGEITFKEVVTKAQGDAIAAGQEVPPCTGAKEKICCSVSSKAQDTCQCGAACNLSKVTSVASGATVWKDDVSGDQCLCP